MSEKRTVTVTKAMVLGYLLQGLEREILEEQRAGESNSAAEARMASHLQGDLCSACVTVILRGPDSVEVEIDDG